MWPSNNNRLTAAATKNVTTILCDAPIRNRTHLVSYAGVVGVVFAFIFYALRMIARLPRYGGASWDDAVITVVMVGQLPVKGEINTF